MIKTSNDTFIDGFEFLFPVFTRLSTGNSVVFTLASGLFVSSIFTYFLVIAPSKRQKQNTLKALLHIPSFILEGEDGGYFTWSKNIIFCDTNKCNINNISSYKTKISSNLLDELAIKNTLEHISETLHLFENCLQAAMSISSAHGFYWMGMTASMKKLSDISSLYDFSNKKDRETVVELYTLYGSEFIQSLELFVRLKI